MMTKNKSRQRSMLKYAAMLPIALVLVLILSQKDVLANLKADDTFIENQNEATPNNSKEKILGDVDEMPRFPGCEDVADQEAQKTCSSRKLIEFMYKNIKYPEAAKKDGIEGTVVVDFMIEADGSLSNFKILKEIGGGCGAESVRVMKMMPKWIPGKKDGKAVAVNFKLPVKFKLEGEDKVINIPKTDGHDEEVFVVVEEMPVFPGCSEIEGGLEKKKCSNQNLFEFLFSNIEYPKEAKNKGIEGKVIVKFIVDKEGNVIKPEILKEPGQAFGVEVLRVVNLMNEMPQKWTPGQQRGKNVNVVLTLPIVFQDEKKETNTTVQKSDITSKNTLELTHFNAFPNPTSGNLNIELGEVDFPTTIKITDINGREVYAKKIEKVDAGTIKINDIDVSNAAKGNLFIVVEQDGKTVSKKIVVQ